MWQKKLLFQQESVQSEGEPEAGGDADIPLEKRPGFINAIKLPLVSVIPRKLRSTKVNYEEIFLQIDIQILK